MMSTIRCPSKSSKSLIAFGPIDKKMRWSIECPINRGNIELQANKTQQHLTEFANPYGMFQRELGSGQSCCLGCDSPISAVYLQSFFCKLLFLFALNANRMEHTKQQLIYTRSSFEWDLFQRAPYHKSLNQAVTTTHPECPTRPMRWTHGGRASMCVHVLASTAMCIYRFSFKGVCNSRSWLAPR